MPHREFRRDQVYLLPPALDDFLPPNHPARYVAAFVADRLPAAGIDPLPAVEGRPSYPPGLLLSCWLYGFMTRVRSSRELERACTENVAFMWLTGVQRPDHNTLWRFYKRYRASMHRLFQQTVHVAVTMGLVDFALQAVDGTKIAAAAADRKTLRRPALEALRRHVETEIADLEAQNAAEAEAGDPTWWLPEELTDRQRLRERIEAALGRLEAEPARTTVNLTDPDAGLMKGGRGSYLTGFNAQAVADGKTGILVALDVMTNAADQAQLVPMLAALEETARRLPEELVADAGYYSGANVQAAQARGLTYYAPVQPPGQRVNDPAWPYHASHFRYDAAADTYTCPQGELLTYESNRPYRGTRTRLYRGRTCAGCPVRGDCTRDPRGRGLTRYPWEEAVAIHRARMATDTAKTRLRQRRQLIEPAFGLIKEQLGVRRFLLRGLRGVRAEWFLIGAAYNLRKLCRYGWLLQNPPRRIPA